MLKIGRNYIFGQNVNIASGVIIGDNVKIQNNVSVYTGVVIEDDVFLGSSCVLANVTNPRSQTVRHGLFEKAANEVLAIPIYPELTDEMKDDVAKTILLFLSQ
ncbi:DapH/DapD/GlmU-related protein [Planctomycetota bacterium]